MKTAIVGKKAEAAAQIVHCAIPIYSASEIDEQIWDFLALSRDGAEAMEKIKDVQCHTLLLPGDAPISPMLQAIQVVAYGFSPRDSLTVSGEGLVCVQRRLISLKKAIIEPQEILLEDELRALSPEDALFAVGLRLLLS